MDPVEPSWPEAGSPPPLPDEGVHVWAIPLDLPEAPVGDLRTILAPDECERADAFHFDRDRRRYTVARGTVRRLLGAYQDVDPAGLRFVYGPRGKPDLVEQSGTTDLRFNLSHSHELALCAVTRGREIGVDVERMRADLKVDAIAERFFSEKEKHGFRALRASRKREAFFRCWTRKEAYQKSRGEGFFREPTGFTVTVDPDAAPRLLAVEGLPDSEVGRWSLRDLRPETGYVGTVIAEGRDWSLHRLRWGPVPRPRAGSSGSGS